MQGQYPGNATESVLCCSVEDAASEVERRAMTVDGGGAAAERLQRSIHELRRVSIHTSFLAHVLLATSNHD